MDEPGWAPERVTLRRVFLWTGLALAATWLLPVDRVDDAYVFVLSRASTATGLNFVALFWPGLVGAGLIVLSMLATLDTRIRAGIGVLLFLSLPFLGRSPLAGLGAIVPPVSGDIPTLRFALYEGTYFPHEGTLHLMLLAGGLALLVAGGRYRSALNTSQIARAVLGAGVLALVLYYVIPYGGEMPAVRNVKLYKGFYEFAAEQLAEIEANVAELKSFGIDATLDPTARDALHSARSVGQIKLTSFYFLGIYFLPVLLIAMAAPALWPSQFRGHRTPLARIAAAGASFYLVAFLFPLGLKEGSRQGGHGALPAIRDLLLLAAFIPGLGVALALLGQFALEPGKTHADLPPDPRDWTEDE